MPAALLTDAGEDPVLMCIVLSGKDRRPFDAIRPKEFEHWVWDLNEGEKMPELPAKKKLSQAC